MEAAEQEKKTSTTTRPDGAKLSFQVKSRSLNMNSIKAKHKTMNVYSTFSPLLQEKMKLFRAEAGENTPNNTAKKTSKVQRDLESPSQESSQ